MPGEHPDFHIDTETFKNKIGEALERAKAQERRFRIRERFLSALAEPLKDRPDATVRDVWSDEEANELYARIEKEVDREMEQER